MWFVCNRARACVCGYIYYIYVYVFLRSQFFFVSPTQLPGVRHPLSPESKTVSLLYYTNTRFASKEGRWLGCFAWHWLIDDNIYSMVVGSVCIRSFLKDGSSPQSYICFFSLVRLLTLAARILFTLHIIFLSLSFDLLQWLQYSRTMHKRDGDYMADVRGKERERRENLKYVKMCNFLCTYILTKTTTEK